MKKSFFVLLLLIAIIFSCACAPKVKMATKHNEFPLMYSEMPKSILILPPMNETTAADAKEYYSTTIQEPLSYTGFYTFPYPVTSEILKMEGIYDSELIEKLPLEKFKEYFGADAVLLTKIKRWDLNYTVLSSKLIVSIDCLLKSTTSNQILWEYNGTVMVDLTGNSGNSGNLLADLLAQAIETAVKSAMADYVPYAMQANYKALSSMPVGKYHSRFNQDKEDQIIDQTPKTDIQQEINNSGTLEISETNQ